MQLVIPLEYHYFYFRINIEDASVGVVVRIPEYHRGASLLPRPLPSYYHGNNKSMVQ